MNPIISVKSYGKIIFSIIVPTYNRGNIIIQTLNSVKNQTFTDWECIIVDDGSTDNTEEMLKEYVFNDSRFQYIHQENKERSAARNNGIKHAQGDYVCFIDSDDFYKKNHLEIIHSFLSKHNFPIAMVFTNFSFLKEGKIESHSIPKYSPNKCVKYLIDNSIIPARTCIHREILRNEKFDEDIVVVEDLVLWLKISNRYSILHIEEPTVLYNLHGDNSIDIKSNGAEKRLSGLKIFFKRYPHIASKISRKDKKTLLSNTLFNVAKHNIYHKKTIQSLLYLSKSIIFHPIHNQTKHKFLCIIKLLFGLKISEYQK